MESRYQLLAPSEEPKEWFSSLLSRISRYGWVAFVTTSNLCVFLVSLYLWWSAGSGASFPTSPQQAPDGLAKIDVLPVAYVPFHWRTLWGNPNATEADSLWDGMNTAHGHIAVDHEWAAANNVSISPGLQDSILMPPFTVAALNGHTQRTRQRNVSPPSIPPTALPRRFPSTTTRHTPAKQLKRVIRTLFLSNYRNTPPRYPMHHALHCFDAIRQHIMCNADNTPLYGHGDGTAGDGQMQRCRSWDALREHATKSTACFRDGEPGMTYEERFGVCDDGTDGLEQALGGLVGEISSPPP
jgi:hypothetical protein